MRRLGRAYIVGMLATASLVSVTGLGLALSATAQTVPDGKALFKQRCGGCHALDRDKEGPRLGGVYGRTAGTIASFPYSDALKKSNIKWTGETLDQWLTDTGKLVPENDMMFRVEKSDERSLIIAYLKNAAK